MSFSSIFEEGVEGVKETDVTGVIMTYAGYFKSLLLLFHEVKITCSDVIDNNNKWRTLVLWGCKEGVKSK